MAEHTDTDFDRLFFERSASTLRVHGILSIVFGSIGAFLGLVIMALMVVSTALNGYDTDYYDDSTFALIFSGFSILLFWILPHVYLIISGYHLTRRPTPKLAKTLIIINLVVGVFYNFVILIFAIVNLTESSNYERWYHLHAHKK